MCNAFQWVETKGDSNSIWEIFNEVYLAIHYLIVLSTLNSSYIAARIPQTMGKNNGHLILMQNELLISQMLSTISDPNLTPAQKERSLTAIEATIKSNYDLRLNHWCMSEEDNLGEYTYIRKATEYEVTLATVPAGTVVKYVTAGRWALYQIAKAQNVQVPDLVWDTPASSPVPLVGKYYFHADFDNCPVDGPIAINKNTTLIFTPKACSGPNGKSEDTYRTREIRSRF